MSSAKRSRRSSSLPANSPSPVHTQANDVIHLKISTNKDNAEFMNKGSDNYPASPHTPRSNISPNSRLGQSPQIINGIGYNALKSFNGQVYSGMAVGGSHLWNYDPGIWKETKEEPDLWKIDFETTKRRAKNAPEGSGAPVGIEYHWLIVAHQYVEKTNANTYKTHLVGSKYKLAHKPATSTSWSIPTVKAQRDRELELLDDAKRRIQGLPPVLVGERIKSEKREKGQRKIDGLFALKADSSSGGGGGGGSGKKRKIGDVGFDGDDDDKENLR